MTKKITLSILVVLTTVAFASACSNQNIETSSHNIEQLDTSNLQKAVFASGCFWCVEAIYESVKGVKEVYSGYAGGHSKNPSYEDSNTGKTGHAEAVEVWYDPQIITFKNLVEVYYASQNIEQVNGQGPDKGSQYRSIIFYQNQAEKNTIETKIKQLNTSGYEVASEVKPLVKFWMGEDYHQNYEKLHPNQGYIKAVSIPRLMLFKQKLPELLKAKKEH